MTPSDRDLRTELENFDGEFPESWILKVGEILVCTFIRYEPGYTSYGPCKIAVVRDEESGEERSVWLLHAVLRREFARQRPKPGDRLGIKRLSDDGDKRYKRYALRVDRKGGDAPDFEEFEKPGDADVDQEDGPVNDDDLPF